MRQEARIGETLTICPVECVKLSARIRAADHQASSRFHLAKADRQSCAEPAMKASVWLILQPAKGEIEILHEAGIPASQTTGGA